MLLAGVLTISLVIDLESKYSKICTHKNSKPILGGMTIHTIVGMGSRILRRDATCESYGKKSWILVDFLVDPIVHSCILEEL